MASSNSPGAKGGRGTMGSELVGKFGAVPKNYKPPRDRPVIHNTVICPIHGTPVGEHCMSSTGTRMHCAPRRRMALRKEREES
jgi:hypothetical protein